MNRAWTVLPIIAIALSACSPVGSRGSTSGEAPAATTDQSRTLRIVARVEAPSFAEPGGASKVAIPIRMFTAGLAATDTREAAYPILAEALPQLNTDSWKVLPDGKMETTFRLRPGLTWHDGAPLTADDFVFALREFKTVSKWVASPGGDDRNASVFMDEIVAVDPRTLTIQWGRPYPGATMLSFQPLPRHLLESLLEQGDPNAYIGSDRWSSAYVGAGPYRMARWERNAFMEGTAFEGFALGRPKIDRIVLTFSDRPPTTVAHLLAGELDIAVDRALEFQEVGALRQDWAARTQGRFLLSPIQLRYIQVQARPRTSTPLPFSTSEPAERSCTR